MKQILVIHGGNSYNSQKSYLNALRTMEIDYRRLIDHTQKWREWLAKELPHDDVLLPSFPNKDNAQYDEWVIYFNKIIPYLTENITLIGYSLGAMFLTKYCNTYTLPILADKIILIAPTYDDDTSGQLGSFSITSAKKVAKNAKSVHLFHSEDDPISPYNELAKFKADMPLAIVHTFINRGHFFQPTFPELLDVIKNDLC